MESMSTPFKFYQEVGQKFPGSKITYKYGPAKTRDRFLKNLLKEVKPKALTLDLGCGDGHYRGDIRRYIGLDMSLGYLKRFQGTRIWAIGQNLPFKCHVFGRIFASEVLEHIPTQLERIQTLEECCRVLRDEGVLIMSVPFGQFPFQIQRSWSVLGKYEIEYAPYVHGFFTRKYTRRLLRRTGFEIRLLKGLGHERKVRFLVAVAGKGET